MRFRGTARPALSAIPVTTAVITWLPIGASLLLGTLVRGAIVVFGFSTDPARAASILCTALGALVGALWLHSAETGTTPRHLVRVSLIWVALTAVLRAAWLGSLIGGGWAGVARDYRIWNGQPGLIMLALVAVAPFLPRLWRRPTGPAS